MISMQSLFRLAGAVGLLAAACAGADRSADNDTDGGDCPSGDGGVGPCPDAGRTPRLDGGMESEAESEAESESESESESEGEIHDEVLLYNSIVGDATNENPGVIRTWRPDVSGAGAFSPVLRDLYPSGFVKFDNAGRKYFVAGNGNGGNYLVCRNEGENCWKNEAVPFGDGADIRDLVFTDTKGYLFSYGRGDTTVIDLTNGAALATIPMTGSCPYPTAAVMATGGILVVSETDEGPGVACTIDPTTDTVASTYPLTGWYPVDVDFSSATNSALVANQGDDDDTVGPSGLELLGSQGIQFGLAQLAGGRPVDIRIAPEGDRALFTNVVYDENWNVTNTEVYELALDPLALGSPIHSGTIEDSAYVMVAGARQVLIADYFDGLLTVDPVGGGEPSPVSGSLYDYMPVLRFAVRHLED